MLSDPQILVLVLSSLSYTRNVPSPIRCSEKTRFTDDVRCDLFEKYLVFIKQAIWKQTYLLTSFIFFKPAVYHLLLKRCVYLIKI